MMFDQAHVIVFVGTPDILADEKIFKGKDAAERKVRKFVQKVPELKNWYKVVTLTEWINSQLQIDA